ncbi:hypothetical protein SUGI_0663170 [Cryptomeria japonica]|nr:hypothetical protein SUGI_0663170 [Cryptomeria japonica]
MLLYFNARRRFVPTSAMGEIREKFGLSLCFVFTVLIQLKSCDAAVEGGDALSLDTSLTGNQTIISQNGTFELGFFNPNGTSNWYVGIWYANMAEKTYVWVANRETPARNRSSVLTLSKEGDLGLFDATGASLWSANVTKKAFQAVILDSGMRFGGQQKLVSWKSSLDPAPGLFSYHVDPTGAKQLLLTWNNSVQYWTSGTWDGKVFSQIPEMTDKGSYNITVENKKSGLYVTYTLKNILSRFVLAKSGEIQQYGLLNESRWNLFWSQPRDQCGVYGLCGAYGSCNPNNIQFCSCVEGFTPRDIQAWDSRESWSSGCVPQSPLNCDAKNGSTDGFLEPSVTSPDVGSASSYPATTRKDCQNACLLNCSCTAFTFKSPSGPCRIWSGDLLNMQKSEPKSNSNVFIRVAASSLSKANKSSSFKQKNTNIVDVVLGIVGALAVALGIFSTLMWWRHRQRHQPRLIERNLDLNEQDSSKYYFPAWAATQIYNGNTINIVEEGIAEERDLEEVRRASIVGLLCIEQDEEVRPSMGEVVLLLEGKMQPQIQQAQISANMDKQANRSETDSDSDGENLEGDFRLPEDMSLDEQEPTVSFISFLGSGPLSHPLSARSEIFFRYYRGTLIEQVLGKVLKALTIPKDQDVVSAKCRRYKVTLISVVKVEQQLGKVEP